MGRRLCTCRPKKKSNEWRWRQYTSADQTPIPYAPWIETKGKDVKSGQSGANKATKCTAAETGDLSVLPTQETSPWLGDSGSIRTG